MKKILTIIFLILLLGNSSNSQQAWVEQQTGYSFLQNLRSVRFINSQTGFICGWYGVFARTTNGGINWIHINNNYYNNYNAISIIGSSACWIAGGYSGSELIKRTTDAGLTWDSLYVGTNSMIGDLQFTNNNTGYYVNNFFVKKTVNGGNSWVTTFDFGTFYLDNTLFFLNSLTGWVSSSSFDQYSNIYTTKIVKTNDGGQNWTVLMLDSSHGNNNTCQDIQFINENTGYISRTSFGIYKTTTGGQNWINVQNNSSHTLFFLNENTGWVGSEYYIRKTTNGGTNWKSENIMQRVFYKNIYFINELTGWAAGGIDGLPKIFKTTNGGVSAIKQISEYTPFIFSLSQNYPNPFNPITNVKFQMLNGCNAKIIVFDMLGKEIATLVNEQLQAGIYETNWDASQFPSGIYFYRLTTDDFTETKKMILLK
jgi:photosystem II stability/assembly factor-like uncharacterized protein